MIPTKTIKEIESPHNPLFKKFEDIAKGKGKKDGLVFVEGADLVAEARKAGALETALAVDPLLLPRDVPGVIVAERLYERLASFKSPAKLMGIARLAMTTEPGAKCIYLDGVQDPGNAGTLIRTALAFGYSSVFFSPDSASPYNPKTIQASKGAIFLVPIGQLPLEKLGEQGRHLYLTALKGQDEAGLEKLQRPFALVLGNEGQGIPPAHLALGPAIRIAMSGIDSLNVAAAGAILMYRFQKS